MRLKWALHLCLSSFELATYAVRCRSRVQKSLGTSGVQGELPKGEKSNILLVSTCLFHNIWATVVQLFLHLSPEDMIQVYR